MMTNLTGVRGRMTNLVATSQGERKLEAATTSARALRIGGSCVS